MKKNSSVFMHRGLVSKVERQDNFNQIPFTIWLTGLSASGKSTLAYSLERYLFDIGIACYVLDGDNIRHGLSNNLSFTSLDRSENIRRIAEVAKLMNDAGLIIIVALISPFISDRSIAREIIGTESFIEVYVNTPIDACELRDPKGLYKSARSGNIFGFTGIDATYEPPINPDLKIDTSFNSVEKCVANIFNLLTTRLKS